MIRYIVYIFLAGVFAVSANAVAATQPTPDPRDYSDPGMHFHPPDGYVFMGSRRVNPADMEGATAIAAWAKFPGKENQRSITITMESYQGSLTGYEGYVENTLRGQVDGLLVTKKELTTTPNGMPTFWMELIYGSGFTSQKRYQYVWYDGLRGVTLAVTGRTGELQESEAKVALNGVYAVLYPTRPY
jgi:hypothetical protein